MICSHEHAHASLIPQCGSLSVSGEKREPIVNKILSKRKNNKELLLQSVTLQRRKQTAKMCNEIVIVWGRALNLHGDQQFVYTSGCHRWIWHEPGRSGWHRDLEIHHYRMVKSRDPFGVLKQSWYQWTRRKVAIYIKLVQWLLNIQFYENVARYREHKAMPGNSKKFLKFKGLFHFTYRLLCNSNISHVLVALSQATAFWLILRALNEILDNLDIMVEE